MDLSLEKIFQCLFFRAHQCVKLGCSGVYKGDELRGTWVKTRRAVLCCQASKILKAVTSRNAIQKEL